MAAEIELTGLFEVADRWFDDCEEWSGTDSRRTSRERASIARGHESAIGQCRAFWHLAPREQSRGSYYELGYVMGLRQYQLPTDRPLVIVTGLHAFDTVFSESADFVSKFDALGLDVLVAAARKWRELDAALSVVP